MENFRFLETTASNQILIHDSVKSGLNSQEFSLEHSIFKKTCDIDFSFVGVRNLVCHAIAATQIVDA